MEVLVVKTASFFIVVLLAMPIPAAAGAKGNFYGFVKAEVTPQERCPIEFARTGIQDSESMPAWNKALVGSPEGDGRGHAGNVRYDVAFQARRDGVEALEIEWKALNAFDETLGTRQMTFEYKKPLDGGKKKYESEAGPRIAEGATKYRVRVLRAKFSDGTIWQADEVPPPPAAEPPKP
jgi:hypothetical protein